MVPVTSDSVPHWVLSDHVQGEHAEPEVEGCPRPSEDMELIPGICVGRDGSVFHPHPPSGTLTVIICKGK